MAVSSNPAIDDNKPLQRCYDALCNRLLYAVLGERLHLGYWDKDTYRMFPLSRALHRMEEKLHKLLDLGPESRILDAGCGCGQVALYMASHGLYVTAIDVTDHHLDRARHQIRMRRSHGLGGHVTVNKMDYHHLESLEAGSFDGIYAMESLCHATNPLAVLQGFLRILRPGGHIAIHDADRCQEDNGMGNEAAASINQISELGAMPTFRQSGRDFYRELLEEVGFIDVRLYDYSENVKPFLRLLWLLSVALQPFLRLFGLREDYPHVHLGGWLYKEQRYWRYVAIAARKPTENT